jgi:chaperonin GroEL
MSHPRLAYDPAARQALRRGFNYLADMMAVTLGPQGRLVAVACDNPRRPPELLNDGAVIARRFTGVANRFETMGAFLARHIAWQVEEAVGDGTTTAVVIARRIIDEADRHIAAGYNAVHLRRGLEKALHVAVTELARLACPLESPDQIRGLATSIIGDETLGGQVEELFDVVGPYGAVEVRTHFGRGHNLRYVNGAHWNQGWVSSYFTTDGGTAKLQEPYILLTNRHLSKSEELLPALERVREAGNRGLVVISPAISGDALNLLVTNKTRGVLPALAIKAPGLGPEKNEVLEDLAVMTGARLIRAETGDQPDKVTLADLGQAREVQAIRSAFTIIGGKGRPAAIRQRSQLLRSQIPSAAYGRERNRLVERAGKLLGGVALLEVGGATESEQEYLKERASEAVQVVRLGLQGGIVPGGGVGLLACLPILQSLCLPDINSQKSASYAVAQDKDFCAEDEAPGAFILAQALAAPMRAIVENSGREAGAIMAQVRSRANGCGYDAVRGELTDVVAANIVDPVKVVQVALQTAVSGALMVLTSDVLVHKPRSNRHEQVDFRP